MNSHQITLVKNSWKKAEGLDAVVVGQLFYSRLFEVNPGLKHMFTTSVTEQSKKLIAMISYVIAKLDRLELIIEDVKKLAVRHAGYGVKPEHYAMVGDALIWTLKKGLQESWDDKTEEAWAACYEILSQAMIEAASNEMAA